MKPQALEQPQPSGCSRGAALRPAEEKVEGRPKAPAAAGEAALAFNSDKAPQLAGDRSDERLCPKESSDSRATGSAPAAGHAKRHSKKGGAGRGRARTVSADVDAAHHRVRKANLQSAVSPEAQGQTPPPSGGTSFCEKKQMRGSQQRQRQLHPGVREKDSKKNSKQTAGAGRLIENSAARGKGVSLSSSDCADSTLSTTQPGASGVSGFCAEAKVPDSSSQVHRMQQPALQDSQASLRQRKTPPLQSDGPPFKDAPTLLAHSAARTPVQNGDLPAKTLETAAASEGGGCGDKTLLSSQKGRASELGAASARPLPQALLSPVPAKALKPLRALEEPRLPPSVLPTCALSPPLLSASLDAACAPCPLFLKAATRSKSQTAASASPPPFWGGVRASRLQSERVEFLGLSGRRGRGGGEGGGAGAVGEGPLWGALASLPGTLTTDKGERLMVSVRELQLPPGTARSACLEAEREALAQLREWVVASCKSQGLLAVKCFEVQGAEGELLDSSAAPAPPEFEERERSSGGRKRCEGDAAGAEIDAMAALLRGLRGLHAMRGGRGAHLCICPEALLLSLTERKPKLGGALHRIRLLSLFAQVSDLTLTNPLKAQLSLKLVLEDLGALVWLAPSVVRRLAKLQRLLQRLTPAQEASKSPPQLRRNPTDGAAAETERAGEEGSKDSPQKKQSAEESEAEEGAFAAGMDPVQRIARLCRLPSEMQQRADIWEMGEKGCAAADALTPRPLFTPKKTARFQHAPSPIRAGASLFHFATGGSHPYGSATDLKGTLSNMLEGSSPVNLETIRHKPLLHHLLSCLLQPEGEALTRDGTEAAGEAAALLEEALAHPLFWGAREIRAFSSASAEALQRLGRQDSLNGERARGGVSQGQGGFGEKTDEVSDPFYPVQKALRSLSAARVPASSLERMRRLLREAQSLEGACEEERKDSSVRSSQDNVAEEISALSALEAFVAFVELTCDPREERRSHLQSSAASILERLKREQTWLLLQVARSGLPTALLAAWRKEPTFAASAVACLSPTKAQQTQGLEAAAKSHFHQPTVAAGPTAAPAVSFVHPQTAESIEVSASSFVPGGLEALRRRIRASQRGGQELLKDLVALMAELKNPAIFSSAALASTLAPAAPVWRYSLRDLLAERAASLTLPDGSLCPAPLPLAALRLSLRAASVAPQSQALEGGARRSASLSARGPREEALINRETFAAEGGAAPSSAFPQPRSSVPSLLQVLELLLRAFPAKNLSDLQAAGLLQGTQPPTQGATLCMPVQTFPQPPVHEAAALSALQKSLQCPQQQPPLLGSGKALQQHMLAASSAHKTQTPSFCPVPAGSGAPGVAQGRPNLNAASKAFELVQLLSRQLLRRGDLFSSPFFSAPQNGWPLASEGGVEAESKEGTAKRSSFAGEPLPRLRFNGEGAAQQEGLASAREEDKAAAARHDTRRLRLGAESAEAAEQLLNGGPTATLLQSLVKRLLQTKALNTPVDGAADAAVVPREALPAALHPAKTPPAEEAISERLKALLLTSSRCTGQRQSFPHGASLASLHLDSLRRASGDCGGAEETGRQKSSFFLDANIPESLNARAQPPATALQAPSSSAPPANRRLFSKEPQLAALRQALLRIEEARASSSNGFPSNDIGNNKAATASQFPNHVVPPNKFNPLMNFCRKPTSATPNTLNEFYNNNNNNPTSNNNVCFNFTPADFNSGPVPPNVYFPQTSAIKNNNPTFFGDCPQPQDAKGGVCAAEQRRLEEQIFALERALSNSARLKAQQRLPPAQGVSAEADSKSQASFCALESRDSALRFSGKAQDFTGREERRPTGTSPEAQPPCEEKASLGRHQQPPSCLNSRRQDGGGSATDKRQVSPPESEAPPSRRARRKTLRKSSALSGDSSKKTLSPPLDASSLVGGDEGRSSWKSSQTGSAATPPYPEKEKVFRKGRQIQSRSFEGALSPKSFAQQNVQQQSRVHLEGQTLSQISEKEVDAALSAKTAESRQRQKDERESTPKPLMESGVFAATKSSAANNKQNKTPPLHPSKATAKNNRQLKARVIDDRRTSAHEEAHISTVNP